MTIQEEPLVDDKRRPTLKLGEVLLRATLGGKNRVFADMGGVEIWIESTEPLVPSAEAFAAVSFLTATFAYSALDIAADVDPLFASNLPKIANIVDEWWGQPPVQVTHRGLSRPQRRQSGKALFFTGGVDSFFSLQRRLPEIDFLINVQGFDISLDDRPRLAAASQLLRKISAEAGITLVEVATNLRDHQEFNEINWGVTHIAAIASVAHLLRNLISTAFVASSDVPPPWGSHQDLDHLWSSSGLTIVNDGWEHGRLDKVRALAKWRMASDNVKVCWENLSDALNCGVCEKCIRSQAQFSCAGAPKSMPSFPPGELCERINSLDFVAGALLKQWIDIRDALAPGAPRDAIEKLIARSAASSEPSRRIWSPTWRRRQK